MNVVLRAAECVLPGHPDKLCDAVADALVQEAGRRERRALCGVEVAAHRNLVVVTGRIACRDAGSIDVDSLVRAVYETAGYDLDWPPAPQDLEVRTDLCLGPLTPDEAEFRAVADDQAITIGYAVDQPATNDLPLEHWLAVRLARRLEALRPAYPELRLGPDGKVLVLLEEGPDGSRLAGLSASLQQAGEGSEVALRRAVMALVREELEALSRSLPGFDPAVPESVVLNGAGGFAVGGPHGDNGLSGKKLVADAYGPRVPIGGGAWSGKDFYKADRAGAVLSRRLARAVVRTGAARECTATMAWLPGDRAARIVSLRGEEGRLLDALRWSGLMDLTLGGLGDRVTGRADLIDVARHGHFTADRPWERLSFDPRGGGAYLRR